MLKELYIKNFAIIPELRLHLYPGLNIFTGETGAGKSIIVEALAFALGGKLRKEAIRSSQEVTIVEALLDISDQPEVKTKLEGMGIETEEDSLIITRMVEPTSRSKAYLNRSLIPLGKLTEIGECLISIHGQHQHQTLLQVDRQLEYLDEFGGLSPLRSQLSTLFREWQSLKSRLREIEEEQRVASRELELIRYQLQEIERANLKPGEEEELRRERELLLNVERVSEATREAYYHLYAAQGSVIERIKKILHNIREIASYDPNWTDLLERGDSILYQLEDMALALRDYPKKLAFDPERLSRIEDRWQELQSLKRKYGRSIQEVLSYRRELAERIHAYLDRKEDINRLREQLPRLEAELRQRGLELSQERRKTARRIEELMEAQLKELGMPYARFQVSLNLNEMTEGLLGVSCEEGQIGLGPKGLERLEFLFSANPGEPPKSLARVASGGELSRIMLALRTILAQTDRIPILVFDEVDVGIGGGIAEVIGKKLREISRSRQVFCITHLPQIASLAERHFHIEKKVSPAGTSVVARELSDPERIREIARMSAGETIGEATLQYARELVERTLSP